MGDFLADRRKALEDSFFAKKDRVLLEQMKKEVTKDELAKASGIGDDSILDTLVAAGFSADAVAALSLAPLVAVAWADGKLDDRERSALLDASSDEGLVEGSVARDLFEGWLNEAPSNDLVPAWKAFVTAAVGGMAEPAAATFRDDLVGRARQVATAAGGILGLGSISSAEQEVLDDLESAFSS